MKVELDPAIDGTAAVVEMRLAGGRVITDRRQVAKGDPDDPLSRAEIEGKLQTAAAGFLPSAAIQRITSMVNDLENLGDVRELLTACRAPA